MRRGKAFLFLGAALVAAAAGACAEPWPDGLEAAAAEHRKALNRKEAATRDGSLASPVGVEESVQFDLQSHACHRGPAQAYREYGEPSLAPPEGGSPGKGEAPAGEARVRVLYPYAVWFRQALTLEEMFGKPWREGNAGAIQVEFRRAGREWVPFSKRELLGKKEDAGGPKWAPAGPRSGQGGQNNPREGGGR